MSRLWFLILLLAVALGVASLSGPARAADPAFDALVEHDFAFAASRLDATAGSLSSSKYPYRTTSSGAWETTGPGEWTSGFFPGSFWLLHERTGEPRWRSRAEAWQVGIEPQKTRTNTHDLGFMFLTSFGNGYRLTSDPAYRSVLLTAANSLATRFNPKVGCIKSLDGPTSSDFRVIIDTMMNIPLLFWAARNGGPSSLFDMAVSHALKTRENHVRADGSTYQIVNYDPATGAVKGKSTRQGYNTESTWSRGQAWAIYGFTVAYGETGDSRFLETARHTADYFIDHLPTDDVPYWDFELPSTAGEPRDSSAAAVAASALVDLGQRDPDPTHRERYLAASKEILASLSSPAYLAEGTTNRAILLHGTQNKNNGSYDTGLVYGDYYFLEALLRYARLAGPDVVAPVVAARLPAPGASGVGLSAKVTATFSEPVTGVDAASFALARGASPVSATVAYDAATRTATLDPAADLAPGTTYTATLSGGPTAIRDIAGNPLVTQSWSFTTGSAGGGGPVALTGSAISASITTGPTLTLPSWTPGANDLILLSVAQRDESKTIQVSGNGLTWTQIANVDNIQGQGGIALWRAQGAAPMTGQITVTITGNTLPVAVTAQRFSGVDTTTPVEATATSQGPAVDDRNMLQAVNTATPGAWAVAVGWNRSAALTPPALETPILINQSVASGTGDATRSSMWYEGPVASPASTQLGAVNDLSAANDWAMIAVAVRPAGSGGGDVTPPSLSSAAVNGSSLTLTYNESLDSGSVPAADAFTPKASGVARTVTNVGITGSVVTLTLASPVVSTDTVTITYTAPGTNPIQDTTGNDAAALTNQAVTNNTPPSDTNPPVLSSAAVNGSSLTLTYNEALDSASTPATSAFAAKVNTVARSVTNVVISGSVVTLTLSPAVVNGDTATIAYTVPGTNPVQDVAGNDAAGLSGTAVTNNTPPSGGGSLTMLPNGDGAITPSGTIAASGTVSRFDAINDTIAAADDGTTYVKNNNKTSGSYFAQLTDTPASFGNMLTLTIDIRARTTGLVDDQTTLYAQVFQADGVTPLTNEASIATNPGPGGFTTISGIPFTGLVGGTKALWDSAQLRLRWAYTAVGTQDTTQIRLTAVEVDGTF